MATSHPSPVRVRFAPSPTGFLHLGGARTALFNWLFARHHGGTFILRIEDTDTARNTGAATDAIFEGLRWLGLDWDEGPFFQSDRIPIYNAYLDTLTKAGRAYVDPEGITRFRVPDEDITVHDTVCGSVTTNLVKQGSRRWHPELNREVEANPDISIRRPDGTFLFHFVNVVDDIEMRVTHIIRGEDHLSNTPKHIALYNAFAAPIPTFAHVPLILTVEGKKLSKRDAGSGLSTYIDGGFIPEAVVNYLALLGWSPKDDSEKLDLADLVKRFDLPGLNNSNARFDLEKCAWLSGQYLAHLPPPELAARALPFVKKAGIAADDEAYAARVIPLVQEKVRTLSEIPAWVDYFFTEDFPTDPEAAKNILGKVGTPQLLAAARDAIAASPEPWTTDALKLAVSHSLTAHGAKLGAVMPALRVALSGRLAGPGVFETMEVLGRDRCLSRIAAALNIYPA